MLVRARGCVRESGSNKYDRHPQQSRGRCCGPPCCASLPHLPPKKYVAHDHPYSSTPQHSSFVLEQYSPSRRRSISILVRVWNSACGLIHNAWMVCIVVCLCFGNSLVCRLHTVHNILLRSSPQQQYSTKRGGIARKGARTAIYNIISSTSPSRLGLQSVLTQLSAGS